MASRLASGCGLLVLVALGARAETLTEAWNGRFQAVGGGGLAGTISYSAMARALQGGYATASTDTGHVAPDVEWLGDAFVVFRWTMEGDVGTATSEMVLVLGRSDANDAYAAYLPTGRNGARQLVRASDGIHMTMNGYLVLAEPVERAIRADLDQARAAVAPRRSTTPPAGSEA